MLLCCPQNVIKSKIFIRIGLYLDYLKRLINALSSFKMGDKPIYFFNKTTIENKAIYYGYITMTCYLDMLGKLIAI